jgi:RNA polymerase sigma factor (sigma-70 family)
MDAFGNKTLGYLRGLLGDDAEDVQQEVWLSVYRGLGGLTNPGAFRTWLYRTTRHRAVDFLRKRKRERELADDIANETVEADDSADDSVGRLHGSELESALMAIPPPQREVMLTKQNASASGKVWEAIENEKRRDRLIRRVSVMAWAITFFFVAVLAVMVCAQVVEFAKGAMAGALPWATVFAAAMPLVIVLGLLSVLVATLSTIGIFLRLRTASLTEIQLRLAALEDMIVAQGDGADR